MIIFSNPGRVTTLDMPALPIRVTMLGWDAKLFNAIITQVGVNNQSGYQFLHSLRDYIYVYIFCERMGELTVAGVTFMGDCSGSGPGQSGIENVLKYYNVMRATNRIAPVIVTIGATTFSGFLVNVRAGIVDASTGLGDFNLKFYFPPGNIASSNDFVGGGGDFSLGVGDSGSTGGGGSF